jgi:L-methionine (R)-S-oxide reductase
MPVQIGVLTDFKSLAQEVRAIIDDDWISSLSNISALLKQSISRTNWIGFYLFKNKQLVLGPFQGLPACTRIQMGRGVCGKAAESRVSLRVRDVHEFYDHIVCDSNSRSELVLPLVKNERLLGVLDLDSPLIDRFSLEDQLGLEKIAEIICSDIQWPVEFR